MGEDQGGERCMCCMRGAFRARCGGAQVMGAGHVDGTLTMAGTEDGQGGRVDDGG